MADLRALLDGAGFEDVRTYLQSGNAVVRTPFAADALADECERLIAGRFGAPVTVLVRSGDDLAQIVARDPLDGAAEDPKRYQVTFLSAEPEPALIEQLDRVATERERVAVVGCEIYAHHPDGVGRSKVATKLAGLKRGVIGTSRNWTTVLNLLEMAQT